MLSPTRIEVLLFANAMKVCRTEIVTIQMAVWMTNG